MSSQWLAFAGSDRIAKGEPLEVALAAHAQLLTDPTVTILAFDAVSSEPVELDLRGTAEDVSARILAAQQATAAMLKRGRGRPRLGVVSKEITLLPRHWEWLQGQSGGASVTLRKLVELAMKAEPNAANSQASLESAYRFMTAMAGNAPGYEEATRALFAKDANKFAKATRKWPRDVRKHARKLAGFALGVVV